LVEVNFFWHGDDFRYIDYLVLKSHNKVGHKPILWFSGKKPSTSYWKQIEKTITIKNADPIFDIRNFLSKGGNERTAADLWRYHFLYSFGGIYCDTDVFALKKFPDDEWIICSGEIKPNMVTNAIIKAPPKQEIFLDCISNIKKRWGNVKYFSLAYRKYFGKTEPTHENRLFFPYPWNEGYKLLSKIEIPWDSYCIHYWAKNLGEYMRGPKWKVPFLLLCGKKPNSVSDLDEKWCKENPETMLGKIWKWIEE